METTKLHEDLLKSFKEEKDFLDAQLDLIDPLSLRLRQSAVARWMNKIFLLTIEAIIWLSAIALLAFCFLRDSIYPFYVLARLRNKASLLGFSDRDVENLYRSIYVFSILLIILLVVLARVLAKMRHKNEDLRLASKTIQSAAGALLHRKAVVAGIEQRHFGAPDPQVPNKVITKSTEMPNPGF